LGLQTGDEAEKKGERGPVAACPPEKNVLFHNSSWSKVPYRHLSSFPPSARNCYRKNEARHLPSGHDLQIGHVWAVIAENNGQPANHHLLGGGCQISMRLSALEEIEHWVLSWGTHATVIKPEALATRVGKIARKLANRYVDYVDIG
jgi:hypothetical protein